MPTVNVAIDGSDVYLKGFTHYLPEAWIKGTLSEDGKSITFPGDQYFGSYDDGPYAHYEFYLLPRLVKAGIFNVAGQRLNTPQKGLNIINGRKVVIK